MTKYKRETVMGKKDKKKKKNNSSTQKAQPTESPESRFISSIHESWKSGNYGGVRLLARQRPESLSSAQNEDIDGIISKVTISPVQVGLFVGSMSFIVLAGILTLQF
tara:strand:- start:95 stop:415 length:321 start_codon:yes stop_codon:yes gene_type:complete